MVGGVWMPDNMSHAFLNIDHDIDLSQVVKAATVLETIIWDPCLAKKISFPICTIPVQHNFAGTGASARASFYVLKAMGKILKESDGLIKALAFDSHGSHGWVRRCLHGQLEGLDIDLSQVDFFGSLEYQEVDHGLPRFPICITKFRGEVLLGLCGPCAWSSLTLFCYFPSFFP